MKKERVKLLIETLEEIDDDFQKEHLRHNKVIISLNDKRRKLIGVAPGEIISIIPFTKAVIKIIKQIN